MRHIKSSKYTILLAVAAILSIGMVTNACLAKVTAEDNYHSEIPVGTMKSLSVETTNGDIDVTGYDGDMIVIDARITVRGKKKDICEELLKSVEIKTRESRSEISIEPNYKKKHKYTISISFDLKVPQHFKAEVTSVNGAVSVANLEGDIEVGTINGQISCSNIGGEVDAGTVNGSIVVSDVSGDVDLGTVNGGIEISFAVSAPNRIDCGTVNGSIEVVLPTLPDADIEVSTSNGRVTVSGIESVQLKGKVKHWEGRLGNGKGDYEFSTINGSISIYVVNPG